MLLTITTTHQPAIDLGYLLHKNPAKVQSFTLAFGVAQVMGVFTMLPSGLILQLMWPSRGFGLW